DWQHLIIRKKKSGVAFLFLDSPGKQNFLTSDVFDELSEAIADIESDSEIKAVVIISGKGDTFVAGADLHEILKYKTEDDGERLSRRGNKIFSELAEIGKPTVAAINGLCVGGGLELALCCDRRIATSAPITVLGLPEVGHGLIPGLGGTQRLPRLIGATNAIELILSGDLLTAQEALDLQLVDLVESPDNLLKRSELLALELVELAPRERKKVALKLPPEDLHRLFALYQRSVRLRTKGRYPAQRLVLDVMKKGLLSGIDEGIEAEISTFSDLAVGAVARNLIFLFFSKELAKQLALKLTKTISEKQNQAQFVIFDPANDLKTVADSLEPDDVLGVLTSTNSIGEITASIPNNANIVGLQFFHPVDQIRVVEIIPHANSSKYAQAQATKFILNSKRLPQIVRDSPGFLLNRIVYAYLQQAEKLAESGMPINWLEKAATDFGMPVGPFAALDEIGLSLALSVTKHLNAKVGERFSIPSSLSRALDASLEGRSTGCGTYIWQDDKKVSLNPDLQKLGFTISKDEPSLEQALKLADMMILPMVDEAARCLEEKVVRRAREIDLCIVLGIGFPAFRGGILKYADSLGIKQVIGEINEIYQQTAPTNRISDYLMRLESESRGFYSREMEQD
ncbi:MAG: enoyl-CoA hydratase/isomerase family protein, partial [Candidatus Melainabacteria bacterium]|nr:enoyl-CoA hydratase/isomerase family protein [Candidatus Melainabacteria bacterium]